MQIYQEARKFAINTGINVKRIYGGTAAWYQAQDLQNPCDILVATPGRLLDFVKRGNVEFSRVRYVVLDEADRMLDMGFITSMKEIVNHPTMTPKVRDQEQKLLLMLSSGSVTNFALSLPP